MPTKRSGEDLLIQYYQGEHKDEYTLISKQEVRHYQNGVLKGLWEVRNGEIIGTFKIFDNGCVQYCQDWNTLKEGCWIRTVNKKLGCMKEYFGFISFKKKEWTWILNDLIQIYPKIDFI